MSFPGSFCFRYKRAHQYVCQDVSHISLGLVQESKSHFFGLRRSCLSPGRGPSWTGTTRKSAHVGKRCSDLLSCGGLSRHLLLSVTAGASQVEERGQEAPVVWNVCSPPLIIHPD